MQLEWMEGRLSPPAAGADSGHAHEPSGVGTGGSRVGPRRRLRLALLLASLSLLGQGERHEADSRFASPSATLRTYWSALARGDAEEVWECFVEGRDDLPMPGMLWFLPPVDALELGEFRMLPVTRGRVLVRYEVRYLPRGYSESRSFRTGDELVRVRGAWRIAQPVGQADMPYLPPRAGSVDI